MRPGEEERAARWRRDVPSLFGAHRNGALTGDRIPRAMALRIASALPGIAGSMMPGQGGWQKVAAEPGTKEPTARDLQATDRAWQFAPRRQATGTGRNGQATPSSRSCGVASSLLSSGFAPHPAPNPAPIPPPGGVAICQSGRFRRLSGKVWWRWTEPCVPESGSPHVAVRAGGPSPYQAATSPPSARWIATTAGRGTLSPLKSGQRVVALARMSLSSAGC